MYKEDFDRQFSQMDKTFSKMWYASLATGIFITIIFVAAIVAAVVILAG